MTIRLGARLGDTDGRRGTGRRHYGGSLSAGNLTGPLVVAGFGMGMVCVPRFDVILAGVEPRDPGSASGLGESVQQLSMSLGIALVGTVLLDRVGEPSGHRVFVHAAAAGLGVRDRPRGRGAERRPAPGP